MDNRFVVLLRKSQAGQISPEELAELAGMLNAPVLDRVDQTKSGFVSKQDFQRCDMTQRLHAIDWFSRCGEPLTCHLSMEVIQLDSWGAATEKCLGDNWEAVTLAAQNQLTVWLHHNDRHHYQSWNEYVRDHKAAIIGPFKSDQWLPYLDEKNLDSSLIHCITWDILGALMEQSYLGSNHRCFFFQELFLVYEDGHFPCGWDGVWPDGKLIAY